MQEINVASNWTATKAAEAFASNWSGRFSTSVKGSMATDNFVVPSRFCDHGYAADWQEGHHLRLGSSCQRVAAAGVWPWSVSSLKRLSNKCLSAAVPICWALCA